jgi:predicted enzyme related to lactoylglutathione lyase
MILNQNVYYPIICSEKLKDSKEFYEYYFDFQTFYEEDGFVVLQRDGRQKQYLGIMKNDDLLAEQTETQSTVSGTLLNFTVENVGLAHQQLEWQGVQIISDNLMAKCDRRFITLKDPNNITIMVTECCVRDISPNDDEHDATDMQAKNV